MRTYISTVPDIQTENIDKHKIFLADRIIEKVSPLLDKDYLSVLSRVRNLETDASDLKQNLESEKELLESKLNEYNRKKKAKKLLGRISELISSGITSDIKFRRDITYLIENVDKMSEDKLDMYLSEMVKIISKRFAKQ